jgi:hypothetical protein
MGIDEQALIWQEKIQSALKQAIEERSSQYRIGAAKKILVALFLGIAALVGLFCLKRRYRRKLLDAMIKKTLFLGNISYLCLTNKHLDWFNIL